MILPSNRLPSFCKPFPSGKLNQLIRQIDSGKLPQPYPVYFLYFKLILSTKICSSCRCYSIFAKHTNICLKPIEWEFVVRQDPNSNINGQCMDLCCVWRGISHISKAVITTIHSVMCSQLHTKLCWYKMEHSGIISHSANKLTQNWIAVLKWRDVLLNRLISQVS